MFTGRPNAAWEKYGKSDPYFGVCSQDSRYKSSALDEGKLEEFFRSGEEHVNFVLSTIQEHIDRDFRPARALDFGCGVGRLTIPLARVSSYVAGVDVSDHMLAEARKNCESRAVTNVDLIKSDDRLSEVSGMFNLVHSFIVFQHIPTRRGEVVLKELIDRLDDGGVGVVHFTYHRKAPRVRKIVHSLRKSIPFVNNAVNLVQGNHLFYPMMQMNNYSLNRIYLVLQERGCNHSYTRFTDHGGHLGIIVFFQKGASVPQIIEDSPRAVLKDWDKR